MKKYQRSMQLWMLLVCGARERRSFTYGEAGAILGMQDGRTVARFLGPVMWYCDAQKLPPLTVLVVNRKTGLPGKGLTTLGEINSDREKVFQFDWFAIEPPEPSWFAESDKPG